MISEMDRCGIDTLLLSAWSRPGRWVISNDEVAEIVARHPDRFVGIAAVDPLYARCIELDVPFCTQVGHTGPAMSSEPGRPVPYLDRVALDFPELRIVGGHIGHPWTDETIGMAWKHDNVFIDTSAYAPRYYPPALVHFASTHGQDKVLFGSNFPQLPLRRCADEARTLDLPEAARVKFLAGNARRVFNL